MNRLWISLVLLILYTSVSAEDIKFDPLLMDNYKQISLEQIIKEPRYLLILNRHLLCYDSFDDVDKSSIEYLTTPDALSIWTKPYKDSAEANLIRGIMQADDDLVSFVLQDEAELLREVESYRGCVIDHSERTVQAIGNFRKAESLGSELATEFLKAYQMKLGEKKFNFYVEESKK